MTRLSRFFLLLLLMATTLNFRGWSYSFLGLHNTTASPNVFVPAHWDVTKLPNSTVTFFLSSQKPKAFAAGDSVEALITEFATATSLWNGVATSSLRVNFGGYTDLNGSSVPSNPMGILTFSSSVPPGALAAGGALYQVPSGTPSFLPIAFSRILMPIDMSQTETFSSFYLTAITHEMGHSLGLNHSHVAAAMFQSALTSRARVLTEDDMAAIALLYPAPAFTSGTGAISGQVTTAAQPNASVVAVSAFSDTVVVGALTEPDGTFVIKGVPPGSYKMMVQPLMLGGVPSAGADNSGDPDDLITERNLAGQKVTINTNIDSAFFASGGGSTHDPGAAAALTVNAGQSTAGANIAIGSRGPLKLEANDTFSFPLNAQFGVGIIWVTQGKGVDAGTEGVGLAATGLNVGFTNSGVALVPSSIFPFPNFDPVFTDLAYFSLQASPQATLGSSSVIYTNGTTNTYFSPGQVRVVATDPPNIVSISPASGGDGATVVINGSNFANTSRVFFDGVQAAVTSTSGTSLVAVAPPGTGGHPASVFVANSDGQGSEFPKDAPVFTYATGPAPSLSISPTSATPGQTLDITVTGTNTNFKQGLTAVGFGAGDIVVNSVSVNSSSSLIAHITVLSKLSSSSFPVTAVSGEEVAFLDNALSVAVQLQQPFTLAPFSGDIQEAPAGTVLPQPIVVAAEDANGLPVPGVTVTFTVVLGGGSISPSTAVTDAQGHAQTTMTLGAITGLQIVRADASQFISTGLIEVAGTQQGFGLSYTRGGDLQTGTVGTALPQPLTLTIVDNTGTILPGIPVSWLVTAGGGTIKPLATVTDSSGKISATWTMGPTAGVQTVRAIPFFINGVSIYGFSGTIFTASAQPASGPPPPPPNVPSITGVLSAAGGTSVVAGISPGLIVSIYGANLSSAPVTGTQPGLIPGSIQAVTSANGASVTFNGVAAPLLALTPTQLNVQVPFEVAGKTSASVVATFNGLNSTSVTVSVLPATPALFTLNGQGTGPGAILNPDFSVNGPSNPAAAGSYIQLFTSGLGAIAPPVPTGQLAPASAPFALSVQNPVVTIDGLPASVGFSGLAPGFVGLWQVNVAVPSGAHSGAVTLQLNAGGQNANPVTVFLQ